MATLTKAEEMKLFRKLVEALPDGYVRDLLTEADEFIERDLSNDICTDTISGLMRERDGLKVVVRDLEKRAEDLRREADATKREIARLKDDLRDVKVQFADLANYAARMAKP